MNLIVAVPTVCLFLDVTASGKTAESTTAIGDPSHPPLDDRLVGSWACVEVGKAGSKGAVIRKRSRGWYEMDGDPRTADDPPPFQFYVVKLPEGDIMCARATSGAYGRDVVSYYRVISYRFDGRDRLRLAVPSSPLFEAGRDSTESVRAALRIDAFEMRATCQRHEREGR